MQQTLQAVISSEHKNRIASRLQVYLDKLLKQQNEPFYQGCAAFSQQLVEIFTHLKSHLPHGQPLHVLSLMPNLVDEYLALKVYYDLHYAPGDYQLRFVSLNSSAVKLPSLPEFIDLHYAQGDLSEIVSVWQLLRQEAFLPAEGFDLILLNKPNITHPELGNLFRKWLLDIIPWAAKESGRVVIFSDQQGELQAVINFLTELQDQIYDTKSLETVRHDNAQAIAMYCKGGGCKDVLNEISDEADGSFNRLSHLIQPLLVKPEMHALAQAFEERDYGALLRLAVGAGNLEIIMELLSNQAELGFDINAVSKANKTALNVLADNKDRLSPHDAATIQSLLVRHGAKMNR